MIKKSIFMIKYFLSSISVDVFAVSAAAIVPKTFRRPSPQKPKSSAQTSPQKQSTLTSFFQPANKKR